MKILTVPSKALYRQAKPVEVYGPKLQTIVDRMFITMYQYKGIGLAANQVGILRQIIVLNVGRNPMVLINPMLCHTDRKLVDETESCLSVPNYSRLIKRQERISITSYDQYGKEQNFEAWGLLARCIQHEVDHLHGVLIDEERTN